MSQAPRDGTAGLSGAALSGARIAWRPAAYDERVASARMRSYLPCRALAAAGVEASIVPPNGAGEYDCVVLQKAHGRHDLQLAERWKDQGVPIVFDLCDNHLWNPGHDPALEQRAERVTRLLELADVVTVSTPSLVGVVAPRPAVVVDDAVEVPARRRLRSTGRPRPVAPVRLAWFGNAGLEQPAFGLVHLGPLVPELERLHQRLSLELTVISNSRSAFDRHVGGASFPTRFVQWRRRPFHRHLAGHDVCLLPIEVNPFTECISANRPMLSLLLGVPVVASRVASFEELAPWVLFEDWSEGITRYATDGDLVAAHVAGARDHILGRYTGEHLVGQWTAVLQAALDRRQAVPDPPR